MKYSREAGLRRFFRCDFGGKESVMAEDSREPGEMESVDPAAFIRTLLSYKWLVILLPFAAALLALGISFLLTPVYQYSVLFTAGKYWDAAENRERYVDSPESIAYRIRLGVYDQVLRSEFDLGDGSSLNLRAEVPRLTENIHVTWLGPEDVNGRRMLSRLVEVIQASYESEIEQLRASITSRLRAKEVQVATLEDSLAAEEARAENLVLLNENLVASKDEELAGLRRRSGLSENRIQALEEELFEVRESIEEVMGQRGALLTSERLDSGVLSLLMTTVALQRDFESSRLEELLHGARMESEDLRMRIERATLDRERILMELSDQMRGQESVILRLRAELEQATADRLELEQQLQQAGNLSEIGEPTRSTQPVAPNKASITAIAFFLGLLVAVFLALFLNYLRGIKAAGKT